MRIEKCRACLGEKLTKFLDLGMHPPSDAFLKEEQMGKEEATFPLDVYFCEECSLMQIGYVVPPELMYNKDYVYVTGVSKVMTKHFGEVAVDAMEKFGSEGCLVVEMGSNDGTMLKKFKECGAKVVGVDSSKATESAIRNGIDTVVDLFCERTATKVAEEKGKARIVIGANVFAHIDDWDDVLRGVDKLLEDDGVVIFEFPYVMHTLKKIAFDQIYHEHLSYPSLKSLSFLFKRFNMELFDAIESPVHTGSIRVFAKRNGAKWPVTENVARLLQLEEENGLHSLARYQEFAKEVEAYKEAFVALLKDLKQQGKKIIGNGAAAKGNTLLNYCKISPEIMDLIVDPNPIKFGMFTPGMHIPVFSLDKVDEVKPDYMVILPWNFQEVIIEQEQRIKAWGGKFIVPLPKPIIVE